jgi:hypothetical protein
MITLLGGTFDDNNHDLISLWNTMSVIQVPIDNPNSVFYNEGTRKFERLLNM